MSKNDIVNIINDSEDYKVITNEYTQALNIYDSKDKIIDYKIEKIRLERIVENETNGINFIGVFATFISLTGTVVFTGICSMVNSANRINDFNKIEIIFYSSFLFLGLFIITMIIYNKLKKSHQKRINYAKVCLKALEDPKIKDNDKELKANINNEILENTEQIKKFLGV